MHKFPARVFTVFTDVVLLIALSAGTLNSARAQTLSPDPVDAIIIRGQVINAPAGARVQAARLDGSLAAETYVSPAGQYAFAPLPPIVYHLLVVDADGQLLILQDNSQVNVAPDARREYVLTVAAAPVHAQSAAVPTPHSRVPGGNVNTPATGQITGVVTAAGTGSPLEYANVEVYDQAGTYVDSTYTAAGTGAYSLTGLATGTYKVHFSPPYGTLYAPEWYNNQYAQANATGISVTDGVTTPNINAVLEVGGQISGHVTAAAGGALLEGVGVYAYTSRTASSYDYFAYAYTDASGVYTLTGLPTGNYYLKFENTGYLSVYYNNRASLAEADPVSVTLGGVTNNINAALTVGGKITGTVTAAAGGAPLDNVGVHAYTSRSASSYDYVASDYTDASGLYTIDSLSAGTYYLKFDPPASSNYLPEFYNKQPKLATADAVNVTLGAVTSNINAALALGGKITGHVTAEESSAPLQDVQISVYTPCGLQGLTFVTSATTDASGNYSVTQLATGSYLVRFSPLSYGAAAAYLDEYYNNKSSLTSATPISVTTGQITGGIDAALTKGGTITGSVTAVNGGASLKDVWVDVYANRGGHWSWVNNGITDASGVYSVTALPADSYGVEFDPMASGTASAYITEYYNDKTTLSTSNQVPVAAGALVSGINAALALGGQFTGTITAGDGGAPLANVNVYVTGSQGYYASGFTNSSGVYITTGLPTGSYLLQFSTNYAYGAAQDYISEYYNNKPTLATADPVALSAPGQSVVNAVLARGGAISGTVTSSLTSKPLPDVAVTVLDGSGNTVKQTYTDAIGNYLARGLPTGVYRVRFTLTVSCSLIKYEIYYNQKPSLNTADPVSVTAPAVTPNINGMLPVPGTINLSACYLPLVYR